MIGGNNTEERYQSCAYRGVRGWNLVKGVETASRCVSRADVNSLTGGVKNPVN